MVCGDRGKHGIAISENRKMNFLGKAGRLARHEERQFEVCGHEFKAQPSARLRAFPQHPSAAGTGLEKVEGGALRGLGLGQVRMVGREGQFMAGVRWGAVVVVECGICMG